MWNGHRFAVSLTWDDGFVEHLTEVCPQLDEKGFKGTFYTGMPSFLEHDRAWKLAHDMGHEIGNHTMLHPGPRNSAFNGTVCLEAMRMPDMEWEIDTASGIIGRVLGVAPSTFAYPHFCHHIGEGRTAGSYYPLVSTRFVAARLIVSAEPNHQDRMNLHALNSFPLDGLPQERAKTMLDYAESERLWLIFHAHHLSDTPRVQAADRGVFRWLLTELAGRDCWVAPVRDIAVSSPS